MSTWTRHQRHACRAARLIDSCITQLKAQGPSRTCEESNEADLERGEAVGEGHREPGGAHLLPDPRLRLLLVLPTPHGGQSERRVYGMNDYLWTAWRSATP